MQFIDLKRQYALMESGILTRIQAVLAHGQYIMGPEIFELEAQLASFVGTRHAVLNSSGTDALLMALLALGVGPGDEVITSPFSFFATAEVIALCHAKPVFVDIDPLTYNLNPSLLEAAITKKTKAIMPVSLYGQCADFNEINRIAERYDLPVIEDAAQSFGAMYHGQYSCALSTIGCASFFPSKPLGAYGDAGACFTNDDALAEALREIRIHGQPARYVHTRIGINGRMDTIQAAILLEKMKYFEDELRLRQKVAQRYEQLLKGVVKLPQPLPAQTSVFAQYTIEVSDRELFQASMQALGIPTAVHYPIALHEQPALQKFDYVHGDFPCAEKASQHVVSLPMHPYLTEAEQQQVASAVKKALQQIQVEA